MNPLFPKKAEREPNEGLTMEEKYDCRRVA